MQRLSGGNTRQRARMQRRLSRLPGVSQTRRPSDYPRSSRDVYLSVVSGGQDPGLGASEWAKYLRAATNRPGWTVARLARESGIARSTLFRWLKDGGERVTIALVRRIAEAVGDDPANAIKAAGSLVERDPIDMTDPVVARIMAGPFDREMKQMMLDRHRYNLARRLEEDLQNIELMERARGTDGVDSAAA